MLTVFGSAMVLTPDLFDERPYVAPPHPRVLVLTVLTAASIAVSWILADLVVERPTRAG